MRVERIPLEVSTRAPTGRTAAHVVGDSEGLLVDPAAIDDRVRAGFDRIDHVAVTHHHSDHVAGVAACAEATDATVWCRYGRQAEFTDATGIEPDRVFRDGTTIPVDEGIVVRETPGHAPEHVAFEVGNSLLSGDLAVSKGSVVVGSPEGDVRAYLTSLRRVHAMAPGRLFAAHGPVIETPSRTCERLITHRLRRERRVLAAVRDGSRTVDEILDAAYEKDLTGVRDLAGTTVRAHLEKLCHERQIQWDGALARPT